MAIPKKLTKGRWRIQVYVKGQRDSKVFDSLAKAKEWGAKRETELREGLGQKSSSVVTTHDAFNRYKEEVTKNHKGERWENLRLDKMLRDFPKVTLNKLSSDHVIRWRDQRLGEVSESSVLRELSILNSVFNKCISKEWHTLTVNPCKGIDRPRESAHRTRTITLFEIRKVLRALGYPAKRLPRNIAAYAFLLALRTGMRQGELAKMKWADMLVDSVIVDGKSRDKQFLREVPLTPQALRVIEAMRGQHEELVFGTTAKKIDVHFRNARKRAKLKGFTFHDSRHTAATWIGRSGLIELMELCKAFGWKDTNQAMTYFNPTGSDTAKKLNRRKPKAAPAPAATVVRTPEPPTDANVPAPS